jgi:hypothetical protein
VRVRSAETGRHPGRFQTWFASARDQERQRERLVATLPPVEHPGRRLPARGTRLPARGTRLPVTATPRTLASTGPTARSVPTRPRGEPRTV